MMDLYFRVYEASGRIKYSWQVRWFEAGKVCGFRFKDNNGHYGNELKVATMLEF